MIGKMGKKYILFSLNADLEARNHGNQHDVKDYYALANECGGQRRDCSKSSGEGR